MLLAVDVGNSHTVIGLFDGPRLRCRWRIGSHQGVTVDELAARLHTLLAMENISFSQISDMVIASVVPQVTSTWKDFAGRFLGQELPVAPLVVSHELDCLIRVALPNPAEVGADRLVNAAAAFHRHQGALIIVDFGTAITLDCVSAGGEYLGGTITPGIAIALEAMGQRTAKLPRVDIGVAPAAAIGTDTVTAIRSGILFGYAGLVDGLVKRIKTQMAQMAQAAQAPPRVLATGGMAELIAPHSETIEEVDPLLTLEGLRLIHENNR